MNRPRSESLTAEGKASLADLFKGRSQLLVYHFMFGPDYAAGCPSCSAIADGFNGFFVRLENHDVMLWAVSRAPLAKLKAYKKRMGLSFPWASSHGSDFNADYSVGFTAEQQFEKGVETAYGGCTSGSTALRRGATRTAPGGAAATSTEGAEAREERTCVPCARRRC